MTSEKLQRTSYRDPNTPDDRVRSGTTTLAENEQDMDQYYRPLERIHGSSLHGWGVASGLSVTATLNSATLTIQPGVALDSSGQHISLAVGGNAEVGKSPTGFSTGATFVPVTASGVAMPTSGLTGDKYLTIQFWETFDSDSYNNLGLFRYWHTPWVQLLDVAGFTNDGSRLVLAKVSFGTGATAGQVSALTQELRRATGLPVGSIHLLRIVTSPPSANVETVDAEEAGVIRAYASGGIDVTVPNSTDEIHLERDDGSNFAKVSLGAERIVARQGNGTESVVIDTPTGTITAGTNGVNGEVSVNDAKGNPTIVLNGGIATVEIGNADSAGVLQILNTSGQATCGIDGQNGKGVFTTVLAGRVHAANGGNTADLGTPNFAGDFSGNVNIAGNLTGGSITSTGNVSIGGNVGIGTTAPLAILDVRGQASIQGPLSINHTGMTGVGSPGDTRAAITFGATDTPAAYYFGAYSGDTAKANTILGLYSYQFGNWLQFWSPNGNIGIGTASPNNQLALTSRASFGGNTSNTGTEPIEVQGPGAGVSFYDRTGGATGRWVIYSDRTGGAGTETLRLWSSGDKVTITQGGDVDITGDTTIHGGTIIHGGVGIDGDVSIEGMLWVNGRKGFVQDHPTDPTRQIVYVSLEGGEAGTYTRGTWKLEEGKAVIELPEHFGMVTSDDGLSVQLTPRGEWLQLYVVQLTTREVVVQEAQGKSGQFDYLIQGVRKGYEHHEVIQKKKEALSAPFKEGSRHDE